jgi:hypothetical protein
MRSIPESDWKIFKQIHPVALERFAKRVVDEVAALLKDNSKSSHALYLVICKLIERRNKELADIFDDYRRSTAFWQIAKMHYRQLITDQEFQQFSPETRNAVAVIQG